MDNSRDHLQQFLRSAHWRWVLWRMLERVGLSVLAGSAISLPLITILWWQGQSAIPIVSFTLAGSAIIGFIVGILRRPSLRDTAMEADRQLGLHDLLTSALMLPACRYLDDRWRDNLLALSQRQCRALSPSQLVLQRLGARAWGGIGLSAALVLTLSLMTATSAPTAARAGAQQNTFELPLSTRNPDSPPPLAASQTVPAKQLSSAETSALKPPDRSQAGSDSTRTERAATADQQASRSIDNAGAGAAASQTDRPPNLSQVKRAETSGNDDAEEGTVAAGAGSVASPGSTDLSTAGVARATNRSAAPWRSPNWSADRAAALESVRARRIPDEYRDLVRGYFQSERD